jgi:hypothetical protein
MEERGEWHDKCAIPPLPPYFFDKSIIPGELLAIIHKSIIPKELLFGIVQEYHSMGLSLDAV